ncbi:MAG: HRDC domain-containing protein [Myxococcota bacterium]|nr:HRDC domain-containing protein [Myxococcota bacterium]
MFGKTPLVMIEDADALAAMVEKVSGAPVVGVDTEADSFHSYQEKVCLVQLSDLETDYIIDPLAIEDMTPLNRIMEDPNTVKVLHGADYDIVSMKRDFGCTFVNVFDTMISSQFLGFERIGLADLIQRFFGHTIDKKYQRHDWSKRPLLPEHLDYARGDTHWLPALRELLNIHLNRSNRADAVAEECELVALRTWQGREHTEADFLRVKGARTLSVEQQRVLRAVWAYRDGEARSANRPAFKLIPDPFLLTLAKSQPSNEAELAKLARKGSSMVRRHGPALLRAVQEGLLDEREIPAIPKPSRTRATRAGPGADRYLVPLKEWRNERVRRSGIAPVAVANNALLKEIARLAPADMQALREVPGIRRWQIADFGEELLELVATVSEQRPASAPSKSRRRRRKKKPGSEA